MPRQGKKLSQEEYEWSQLIPRAAYPHWEADLRAFLYCSTEERAEWSFEYYSDTLRDQSMLLFYA